MANETTRSGSCGKLMLGASDIAEVRDWTMAMTGANPNYVSSSSAGHQQNKAGPKSATLSFNVLYDTDDSIYERMELGDAVTLLAYIDAVQKFTVPCRITSMEHSCPIESGDMQAVAVEAASNGRWTYPDGVLSAPPC